jgi:hypothetical protein
MTAVSEPNGRGNPYTAVAIIFYWVMAFGILSLAFIGLTMAQYTCFFISNLRSTGCTNRSA